MARELENLVAQWSERRGIAPAAPSEDGKRYYVFDGDYEVALSQAGARIYFETGLVPLPAQAEQAEALLEKVMKLQLARAYGAVEVLSLTPEGDGLVLFQVVPAERMDPPRFENALGAFVNAAAFWAAKLGKGAAQSQAALPPLRFLHP